ncbi:hypothetical protein CONCODRAFT_72752 [Conidiobolus coronatus NRRL 28638]|uniref:Protein PNS1 n=1 Tax=Conidiobolus coronatus (strain ATCC 28846 / CBS 209.66 / NRRL 28638) TaxID=796925 RepID=A0A137NYL4_CONC2|nr:hypothetical protein CONCODRAFT_72752 [Conidiobolus coronatus NRRL 28638]|eukprot:KXN67734.1 hypothetical protein CONCODRAFT_72752 [Conidiobolus coronatus NRRL 28638]
MSYNHHSNRSSRSEDSSNGSYNYQNPRVQSPAENYSAQYYNQGNLEPLYETNFRDSIENSTDRVDFADIINDEDNSIDEKKNFKKYRNEGDTWLPPVKEYELGKGGKKLDHQISEKTVEYPLVKRESIIGYDTHQSQGLHGADMGDYAPSGIQTTYHYQNGYWGALFLLNLLFYTIYSMYSSAVVDIRAMEAAYGNLLGTKATIMTYLVAITGTILFNFFTCIIALVIPRIMIYFMFALLPLLSFVLSVLFFVKHAWLPASLFLIAVGIFIIIYIKLRPKLDFSISILNHTQQFLLSQKTLIIFGFVVQIIAWIYLFSWVNSVFTIFYRYDTVVQCMAWRLPIEPCSPSGLGTFFIVLMVLSLMWTATTFKGVIHMISSSIYTIHHFFPNNKNSNFFFCITRALTTHLGIAATNAIFTPPVALLKGVISLFTTDYPTFFTRVIRRYNDIGLTYSLIHDNDYTTSNILGFDEMDHTGVFNMLNDSLIKTLITLSTLLAGIISTLLGYLSLIITNPPFNQDNTYTFGLSCGYFVMGCITHIWLMQILQGCNNGFFVCLASDPNSININNHEIINRLNSGGKGIKS